jgi:hypothetical protein
MKNFLEKYIVRAWNRHVAERSSAPVNNGTLDIGARVVDGEPVGTRVGIAQNRRAESIALVGKSGSGKTKLIRKFKIQDVEDQRYFADTDLHGEEMNFTLKVIAQKERTLKKDLSGRVIAIDLGDPEFSVGINPLEGQPGVERFTQIAEIAQILKDRFHLDTLGARTEELLRNTLYALAENDLTLVELAPFLGDEGFRSRCTTRITNADVREYFETRYNQASDAMRRMMAEPVLNKVSLFVSDVRFRHLLGQQRSTFSLVDAMDRGCWILLNLDKGKFGESAATFGSLFIAKFKHGFFARKRRELFTLYCDEIQNLVTFGGGLEVMLAEIRKRGGSIVSAHQWMQQLPQEMQAAILSVGSLGFFQLSGADAQHVASMLDGGKSLVERLKNLPRRHLIVKTVHERWCEAVVPVVREPNIDPSDLYRRSCARWARPRREIEEEIRKRREVGGQINRGALDGWE